MNAFFTIIWMLLPVVFYFLFKSEKYGKALQIVAAVCLAYVMLWFIPSAFGWEYKYDFFSSLGSVALAILFFVAFYWLDKKGFKSKKLNKFLRNILVLPPLVLFVGGVNMMNLLRSPDSGFAKKVYYLEEYTVKQDVEWFDNNKYYMVTTIHKDNKYLPILCRVVYTDNDYNVYVENATYSRNNKTISILLSNGREGARKETRTHVVDLQKELLLFED